MINSIRKYPKITLGIFSFCCLMFVFEFFIRSFFYSGDGSKSKNVFPDVVKISNNKLTFDDYKKKVSDWSETSGQYYIRFGIDRESKLFKSSADRYVVNGYINDVIYGKLSKFLGISVGDFEKYDVIYGDNLDESLKQMFSDSKRVFDRSNYDEFLNKIANNQRLRSYWNEEVSSILKNRVYKKVKDILDSMVFENSLELQRKFKDKNSKFDIKYVFINGVEDEVDFSEKENEMKSYYEKNKNLFKCDETYKLKYFEYKFDVDKSIIESNNKEFTELKDKFKNSLNPVEFAKIFSDKDNSNYLEYSKSYYRGDLPSVFDNSADIYKDDVCIEFPKKNSDMVKIYRVVKIYEVNRKKKYDLAILYKKLILDNSIKEKAKSDIENRINIIKNVNEFEEFASELGFKVNTLDLTLGTNNSRIENINELKKIVFKRGFDSKKSSFLPIIESTDCLIVSFFYDHIPNNSVKAFDDVNSQIKMNLRKKFMKDSNIKRLDSHEMFSKGIDEYRKDKKFTFGVVNDLSLDNISKKSKNDQFLKKLFTKCNLIGEDVDSKFFYFSDKIVKVSVKNKSNYSFESDDFVKFKKDERDKNEKSDYIGIFEKLYNISRIKDIYNLL